VPVLAEILGPDLLIILVVVALLFGSSRLPKLARSLGSAKAEFEKGIADGAGDAARGPGKPTEETVTLTQAELNAMLAERERKGRAAAGQSPPDPPSP
jgi:sec-independent protein translocase protein TatA